MKKVFILIAAFAIVATSFAATVPSSVPKKANEIYLPLRKDMRISLLDLSKIKVKDYEKITGNHLNFFQKIAFKAGQKKLRNSISDDGTITNKKVVKALSNGDPSAGFNVGWFVLGLLLGLIGVLLSYVINGDPDIKKNRQKWAWIGWGVWIVIFIFALLL